MNWIWWIVLYEAVGLFSAFLASVALVAIEANELPNGLDDAGEAEKRYSQRYQQSFWETFAAVVLWLIFWPIGVGERVAHVTNRYMKIIQEINEEEKETV